VAEQLTKEDERAVEEFEPRVVFQGFGDSSINFNTWLKAKQWEGHFGLQDAYVRKLHKRFNQEGINIPFPIRTLHVPKGTVFDTGRRAG